MNVPIRTFDFGELLDGAFTLYRRNFATFFGTGLLLQLPIILTWLAVPALAGPGDSGEMIMGLASLMILPYSVFATVLMWAALTWGAGLAYAGEAPTIGTSLRAGMRRWWPTAVASLVAYCVTVLGFAFFIIPGLVLLAMFFGILPAVVIEERGPFEALVRSQSLSKGDRARILGVLLVTYLLTIMPIIGVSLTLGVSAGVTSADPAFMGGPWFAGLAQAASSAVSALTWPLYVAVVLLLYVDRRARTEPPDLVDAVERLRVGA